MNIARCLGFALTAVIATGSPLVAWSISVPEAADQRPDILRRQAIPSDLFGMHIHEAAGVTPWPTVPFASWRLHDAYVGWSYLEPEKGRWDFSKLDRYVALAQEHQVEILLPLQFPPGLGLGPPYRRVDLQHPQHRC
ncbi:beta-galactosidase [Leptolyngbya sp. FACHB-261]|uniref:beta-galactosidase n=1 Tax=Leptolyngbya sp. FACHB-261 TaxID=2692806 RepID=UPI0019B369B9|nr:beta-galactosidase [Leptolyngbya sp. FACHB-261]MBD2101106.1 beta-galactosidase [Leptolyngbya sp. FACHB-261]